MIELFQNIINAGEDIKEHVFLVDVRTPEEFNWGSVDGSINIPLSRLEQELSQFENKENIIVFCRSGARSGNAQVILQQHGFENVVNGGPWQNVQQALEEFKLKTV